MQHNIARLGWIIVPILAAACSPGVTTPIATSIPLAIAATSTLSFSQAETPAASPTLPISLPLFHTPRPSLTPTPRFTPTPSATPAPPEFPISGIEVHDLRGVELAGEAGAYWLRINGLLWASVEPVPGEFNWEWQAALEAELAEAAERGMQVILVVRGTPGWAQKVPGAACGPVSAEQLAAFGEFLYAAVARYSAPPYNVLYWELGNEPDVAPEQVDPTGPFGCWGEMGVEGFGGAYYAEMLKTVTPRIKAAQPAAQVLLGGLLLDCDPVNPPLLNDGSGQRKDCSTGEFLGAVLENGGGDYFDGVSFHAYDFYYGKLGGFGNTNWNSDWSTTGPTLAAKAGYLRSVLNAHGYGDKYLINTEIAVLCGSTGNEPVCLHDDFLKTKAYFVIQAHTMTAALGLRGAVWFSINGWRSSGLVSQWFQPLEVYEAFGFNSRMLDRAAFWGENHAYAGIRIYEFRRGEEQFWIAWSQDGETHSITLDSAPLMVYDYLGRELTKTKQISVSLAPIYIQLK